VTELDTPRAAIYRTMRELSGDERPRERLLRHGAGVLGDAELVAILLGSGLIGENVLDFSRRILDGIGGLDALARADASLLRRVKGLGPARAAQLAAAIELGRRVQQANPDSRPNLAAPESVAALLGPRLAGKPLEEVYAIPLDSRGRLLGALTPISNGGANAVTLRPAEVFREAIMLHAVSIILVHNHPSGDPRPSTQDVSLTRQLIKAGELLDILVLDHVILAGQQFISFKRDGYAFQ
jgi:DNA repair protein RadC